MRDDSIVGWGLGGAPFGPEGKCGNPRPSIYDSGWETPNVAGRIERSVVDGHARFSIREINLALVLLYLRFINNCNGQLIHISSQYSVLMTSSSASRVVRAQVFPDQIPRQSVKCYSYRNCTPSISIFTKIKDRFGIESSA